MGILKHRFEILYTFTTQEDISLHDFEQQQPSHSIFRNSLSDEAIEQLESLRVEKEFYDEARQQQHQTAQQIDDATWSMHSTGRFTVSSAYFTLQNVPTIRSTVSNIWNLRAPPRYKIFAWLLIHRKILTAENLMKIGYHFPSICYMCRQNEESIHHMFNECTQARMLYEGVIRNQHHHRDTIAMIHGRASKKERELILIAQFTLWRERCCRIFRETNKTIAILVAETVDQWKLSTRTTMGGALEE